MTIGVHIRQIEHQDKYVSFIIKLISDLAKRHSGHSFVIIGADTVKVEISLEESVSWLHQKPLPQSPILWKLWYHLRLPLLLRKHHIDILLCVDSLAAGNTKIPQLLILKDLEFLYNHSIYNKIQRNFLSRSFSSTLKKVNHVITFSQTIKIELEDKYSIAKGKSEVVIPALLNPVTFISVEQKLAIKDQFTEGKEFFIYTGSLKEKQYLISLLKAFTIFKKRQRSSWKLVLLSHTLEPAVQELLKTYKFKEDVLLVSASEKNELMATAYAAIYTDVHEGFVQDVQTCMMLGVPVIAPEHSVAKEVSEPAGLYYYDNSPESIAGALMIVYKDEAKRSQMIHQGKESVAHQDKNFFLDTLWEKVIKAATT